MSRFIYLLDDKELKYRKKNGKERLKGDRNHEKDDEEEKDT